MKETPFLVNKTNSTYLSQSNEYQKNYRDKPKNKEKARIYQKEYRNRPGMKIYRKEYMKKWNEENKDEIRTYKQNNQEKKRNYQRDYNKKPENKLKQKENYQKNKDEFKAYYQKNKDKIKEHNKISEVRRRNNQSALKYKQKYPERHKAVGYAYRYNQRNNDCELCTFFKLLNKEFNIYVPKFLGDETKLHFHHINYANNEGSTLCQKHHVELHEQLRAEV
ncbi:MAG: hypothetical protein KKB31_03520 [Nanoarchaeota archaeon]|nr:hypothetical protein [Nanoarchaeota archaeon]